MSLAVLMVAPNSRPRRKLSETDVKIADRDLL